VRAIRRCHGLFDGKCVLDAAARRFRRRATGI
jgi:hypothetical protein